MIWRVIMILSFAILKGGTGKTTFNVNIAAALAAKKKRILIVDCDPQKNASLYLGVDEADISIYDVIKKDHNISNAIIKHSQYVHIIPGSSELSLLNLDDKSFHYDSLKDHLNIVSNDYDVIFIDAAPGITKINASVFKAIDEYIIPIIPGALSLSGLKELEYNIELIRGSILKPLGIVLNKFNARRNIDIHIYKELHQHYPIFKTFIRQNIRFEEAAASGMPVIEYDPKCNGSIDIVKLASEVLKRVKKYL